VEEQIQQFRNKIDEDNGFIAKRRGLTLISMILLGFAFTGAKLTEINTFIFKFTLEHQGGLLEVLVFAQVYYLLRYYSYAFPHQRLLSSLWQRRLMSDYRVFHYDDSTDELSGLVSKKMNIYGGDYPESKSTYYRVDGVFRRSVCFESYFLEENDERVEYLEEYRLNQYDKNWSRKDLINLLKIEYQYRLSALFQYRENLDIRGPYIIALISLLISVKNYELDFSRFIELLV